MRQLPIWVLPPTMPSIFESESFTALEAVAKVYGSMRKLIEEYNAFANALNKEIEEYNNSNDSEIAEFKESVERRLMCKFQDLDKLLSRIRLEMKKYTDEEIAGILETFGVTVKASGDSILVKDSTNEKIRGLTLYGKTVQAWDPVPEYPAALNSVGSGGSVAAYITDGDGNKQQTIRIATPEGLRGIKVPSGGNYTDYSGQGWACDEVDLKRGVYVQRIHKIKLTGTEKLIPGSSWASGCFTIYTKDKNPNHVHGEIMCSFLPPHSNADLASGKYGFGIGTHGEPNLMVRFGPDKTMEESAELWEKAITGGGEVYAILENPVERPLTAAELAAANELRTFLPETRVITETGAGIMLEYVAITQNYLENHMERRAEEITRELVTEAIRNGEITVGLEYNEETEEANIIVGGEV